MERQEMLKWKKAAWQKLMGAIAMLTGAAVRRLLRHQQQTPLDETPDPELERETLENAPEPRPDPRPDLQPRSQRHQGGHLSRRHQLLLLRPGHGQEEPLLH